MKAQTNKYIDVIWSIHESYFSLPGMGNYGGVWEALRAYYQELSPTEKRQFEEAILTLCRSEDLQRARFALTACAGLAGVFPKDWPERVSVLVNAWIVSGLEPRSTGTVSHDILGLVWEFRMQSLIPFVKEFRDEITTDFKSGRLTRGEWEDLYRQVSRAYIRASEQDFWNELRNFHQDRELVDLLGSDTAAILSLWIRFGAGTYGLDWLSKMVMEYSRYSDETLKSQVLLLIKESFSIAAQQDPKKSATREEFLGWAEEQLATR